MICFWSRDYRIPCAHNQSLIQLWNNANRDTVMHNNCRNVCLFMVGLMLVKVLGTKAANFHLRQKLTIQDTCYTFSSVSFLYINILKYVLRNKITEDSLKSCLLRNWSKCSEFMPKTRTNFCQWGQKQNLFSLWITFIFLTSLTDIVFLF